MMTAKIQKQDRYVWGLLLWGLLGACAVVAPQLISPNSFNLELFVLPPVIGLGFLLALVIVAWRRKWRLLLSIVALLVVFCLASYVLTMNSFSIRSVLRWAIWAREYKAEVRARPTPPDSELQHVRWDSWGLGPVGNTDVFLVFDPQDSLRSAPKTPPGKLAGIPCPPHAVKRLEANWYAVTFFTDQSWDVCPASAPGAPLRN